MKRTIFLLLCTLLSCVVFAQSSRTIKGKITDDTGAPLPAVSVVIKGTTTGAQTDDQGIFSIKTTKTGKAELVISYTGYKTKTITEDDDLTVKLEKEQNSLDEVVIVGYQAVKKRDLTASVSSVGAKDLKDIPLSSAAEALSGRMAGVQVVSTEGKPGADVIIRVRGGGSITQDNSPLYVVDGIQVENALSFLSPQEIQSVDVLKDAAATAIYGARGANGVVVITTKGGKEMKTRVTYDGFVGARTIVNKLDVMKPYDYVMYQYQLYNYNTDDDTKKAFQNKYGRWEDLDIYKNMPFRDWQDEVFGRTAKSNSNTVTVSGGNKSSTFNLTLNNNLEDGIMLESGFRRTMASFRFDHKASDRFRVGFNARYGRQRVDGVGTSNSGSQGTNRLRNAVRYQPYVAAGQESTIDEFDPDYANLTNLTNPVLLAHNELKYDYRNDLNLSGNFSYDIIRNHLTFKSVVGIVSTDTRTNSYSGSITSVARQNANMPVVSIASGNALSLTNSNTLTYRTTINNEHNLNVLLGQEIYQIKAKSFNATQKWMPVDLTPEQAFAGIQKATPPSGMIQDAPTTGQAENRLLSFFGSANYAYKGRYLATVTARYDGSTKFNYENGFAFFPSVALAWRISQENFFQSSWVNDLKLRVSMGTSGNNRIADDLYKTMFGTSASNYAFEESITPGIAPLSLANPNLKWETTVSRNLGLDFSLFKSRLSGSLDFYYNNTHDLLVSSKVPVTTGYAEQIQNVGKTQNKGVELQLAGTIISNKNFSWNANFNIATNSNKIVSLGTDPTGKPLNSYFVQSGWVNSMNDFLVEVGKPVGQYYGYVTDGYYSIDDFDYNPSTQKYTLKAGLPDDGAAVLGNKRPQPGDLKLKKLTSGKDSTITENDKTVLGNNQPKFTGGLNQQFVYKNFDLSVFVNFSYGAKVYNANRIEFTTTYQYKDNNYLDLMTKRFRWYDDNGVRVNDPAALKALNANTEYWTPTTGNYALHSFAIEDGSFLRISNVTLGYSLPQKLLRKTKVLSRFRVYATVNNLWTITGYTGYDPEASTRRSNYLTPGVDYAAYPRNRYYVFGLNVGF